MPRKRSVSANYQVAAGPAGSTGVHTLSNIRQLYGVTSVNWDYSQSKENVSILGQAARVARVAVEPPTISLNVTYNQASLDNEKSLGFVVNGQSGAFANILNGTEGDRNLFVARAADGLDAIGLAGANVEVQGYGNSTISSYAFEAAVGSFPTTSVGFQALEVVNYADGASEVIPAINTDTGLRATGLFTLPTFSGNPFGRDNVLLPGDITVDFSAATGFSYVLSGSCVQSVSVNVDFNRDPTQCLGLKTFGSNPVTFPIDLSFSADIFPGDLKTGSLSNFLCNSSGSTAVITIRRPNCTQGAGAIAYQATLRNLDWDGENSSIPADGSQQVATIAFLGSIGGANDVVNGLFLSGVSYT